MQSVSVNSLWSFSEVIFINNRTGQTRQRIQQNELKSINFSALSKFKSNGIMTQKRELKTFSFIIEELNASYEV